MRAVGACVFASSSGWTRERPSHLGACCPRPVSGARDVVIVGDGPAGMLAAYELARHGVGCTVIDRGKQVQPRRRDLRGLTKQGVVDPDSNYCFGEGGAGTYSDGKLYTRAHKRGNVRDVIEILALHGAPQSILVDARPHIGSNRLPQVVTALRTRLEQVGVEFRFEAKVVELLVEKSRVVGVRLADGREIAARYVVVATGHSARDVFLLLERAGVKPRGQALRGRRAHRASAVAHQSCSVRPEGRAPKAPGCVVPSWPRRWISGACSRFACAPVDSWCRRPPRRTGWSSTV